MSTAAEYHCSPVTTTATTSIASSIASFIDILFFVLSNLLTSLSLSFFSLVRAPPHLTTTTITSALFSLIASAHYT